MIRPAEPAGEPTAVEGGQVRWDAGVPGPEAAETVLEDFYALA